KGRGARVAKPTRQPGVATVEYSDFDGGHPLLLSACPCGHPLLLSARPPCGYPLLLSACPPCERYPQWARTATPSVWVLLCGGSMAESLKSNGSPQRRTHRTGDRQR